MNQGQQEENDTESRITAGMDTGNEDDNKISGIKDNTRSKAQESRTTAGQRYITGLEHQYQRQEHIKNRRIKDNRNTKA